MDSRQVRDRALDTVPGRVVRKFGADNGPNQAVLIAWNVLFSIFPMLLAMAAVLGLVLSYAGVKADAVYQTVLALVPDEQGRRQALAGLDAIRRQTGLFFVVGFAGLVWSGSSLFGVMERSFDRIYACPPRAFLRQKLMGVLMMLLFTVLVGVAVGTSALLPLLKLLPVVPAWWTQSATLYLVQPLVGVASGVLLFGTLYYAVPNRRGRVAAVWPGAVLAGIAFYLLTLLFPLYLSLNRGLNQYGASFTFLFIVLTFFYFLGLITILGAELNAVLWARRVEPVPAPATEPGVRRSPARTIVLGVLAAAIGVFAVSRRR